MTVKIAGRDIDGILFDINHTFYTQREAEEIFGPVQMALARSLCDKSGGNSSIERVAEMRDYYVAEANRLGSWRNAFLALGGDESIYRQVFQRTEWSAGLRRNDQLLALVMKLHQHVSLGIISGGLAEMVAATCSRVLAENWRDFFPVIVTDDTENLPAKKPDLLAFEFALRLMGTRSDRTAMVGNSVGVDIIPAATLGLLPIMVGDLGDGPWHLQIPRLEDLAAHIQFPR